MVMEKATMKEAQKRHKKHIRNALTDEKKKKTA